MPLTGDPQAFFTALQLALVFIGPCLGSFASAIAWRVPRGLSWITDDKTGAEARSTCPCCGYRLGLRDLVPIFSWLSLRGRCRSCGARIGVFYPLLELMALLLAQLMLFSYGPGWPLLLALTALPFLLAQWVILWQSQHDKGLSVQLLTLVTGPVLALTLLEMPFSLSPGALVVHGFGALLFPIYGLVIFRGLRRDPSLTGEELKKTLWLLASFGLWKGAAYFPVFLILTGGAGLILAASGLVLRRRRTSVTLAACVSAFLLILAGGDEIMALLIAQIR